MSGRLKHIDYEAIIAEGKPWKDPVFPFGKVALFINNAKPRKEVFEQKKKWLDYHWKRASEYFGEQNFKVFDGIYPSDIIMGKCNNCYALAALCGISEATDEEAGEDESLKG